MRRSHSHARALLSVLICVISLAACSKVDCPKTHMRMGDRCIALRTDGSINSDPAASTCAVDDATCPARHHTTRQCTEANPCHYTCEAGFADCNNDLASSDSNGCEASLNDHTTCGACGTVCATDQYCGGPGEGCRTVTTSWANAAGAAGIPNANAITVDAQGNSYIAYSDTADEPYRGTVGLESYTREGGLRWKKIFVGPSDQAPVDIAVHPTGTVYVLGEFNQRAMFGTRELFTADFGAFLLAVRNEDGGFVSAENVGGTNVEPSALTIDVSGNLFIVGRFLGETRLTSNTPIVKSSMGTDNMPSWDGFVLRFHGPASWWTRQISGIGLASVNDIAIDQEGHLHITGEFNRSAVLEEGPDLSARGGYDTFVAQLSIETGKPIWVTQLGGPEDDSIGNVSLGADGLAVSGREGQFAFVASLAKSDGLLQWQKKTTGGRSVISAVGFGPTGHVYGVGSFDSVLRFDGGFEVKTLTAGDNDVFLCRFTRDGRLQWLRAYNGMQPQHPADMAFDQTHEVLITGYSLVGLDFGTGLIGGTRQIVYTVKITD